MAKPKRQKGESRQMAKTRIRALLERKAISIQTVEKLAKAVEELDATADNVPYAGEGRWGSMLDRDKILIM